MKENLNYASAALIKWITLAVVFVTPLLFMPWTFDAYEFPKQVFLWIAAAILLVLWLLRFVLGNEVKIIKTPVDLPLILFILISLVSMFLSSSRYISLVGFFGRPDSGFASIIAYAIIFYVASSTMTSMKDIVQALSAYLLSSVILAILGILYYFHVFILPWSSSKVNTFSPAGGMFALTVLLGMAIPVALGFLLYLSQRNRATETEQSIASESEQPAASGTTASTVAPFLAICAFLCIAIIALLGNYAAWAGVIAAVAVFFLWSKRGQVKAMMPYILAVVCVSLLWILLAGIPQIRSHIPHLAQPVTPPQVLSAAESWHIAGSSVTVLPFFGSGPATYLYDFTRYHSVAYNELDNWTLRYLVAHDQYLQVLTTLGVLGFIAYLFFVGRILLFGFRSVLTQRDDTGYPLKVGVFAAICAYFAACLFVVPTTAVTLMSFMLLALLMALEKRSGSPAVTERRLAFVLTTSGQPNVTTQNNIVPMLLFVPALLLAVVALFATSQYVRANVMYVHGVNALSGPKPNAQTAVVDQTQAVLINPWEDGYHRDLARTSFNVALAISQKGNLTDKDKSAIAALLQTSISQAQRAASLSPLDANNWQTLGDIYRNIASQVQGAGDAALSAYQQAILDDQNPQLYLNIGGIFYAANSYDQAIDAFRQAINLKPNYANAYYNLANAYVKKNDYNNAYTAYQYAKAITQALPNTDPGKQQSLATLDKEMAAIADKVSTQSATPATGQNGQQSPSASASAAATPTASPTVRRTVTPVATPKASAIAQPSASPSL